MKKIIFFLGSNNDASNRLMLIRIKELNPTIQVNLNHNCNK